MKIQSTIGLALLFPTLSFALPSGMSSLPEDLVIPEVNGRPLPVKVIPDDRTSRELYVLPLEGMFVEGKKMLKKFTVDCQGIKQALEGVRRQNADLDKLDKNGDAPRTDEVIDQRHKKEELIKIREDARGHLETGKNKLSDLQKAETAAQTRVTELTRQISELDGKIAEGKDVLSAEEKQALLDQKTDLLSEKRRAILTRNSAQRNREKQEETLVALQTTFDEADGAIRGIDQGRVGSTEDINVRRAEIEKKRDEYEARIAKAAQKFGADVRLTMHFAPVDYIVELEKKNPRYNFKYVPSLGGGVKLTFPKAKEDSTLNGVAESPILAQEWDRETAAMEDNPFYNAIAKRATEDQLKETGGAVNILRSLLMQFSDPLEGARQLTLRISELGYCSMVEPQVVAGEYENTIETYALSYFFSYPMKFDVRVRGSFDAKEMLHSLYERKKKSGFFSSSDRTKFIQDTIRKSMTSISVDSSSPLFGPEESNLLKQKTLEFLSFAAARKYIEVGSRPAMTLPEPGPIAPGANSIRNTLVMIPNPWTFWTGNILGIIGNLFGSATVSVETTITHKESHGLKTVEKFSLPVQAAVTIGSLKSADFKQ